MINEWGPAILVCLTVTVGLLYGNSRITDLRNDIEKRFDDLKDWIRSEIRRLEERSSPIHRG